MSIDSLRHRVLRLHTAKADFRHGLADRLAAARANRMAQRAERVRQGLPADLTPEERIAKLSAWLDSHEHYAQAGGLARRLYQANRRMQRRLEASAT